MNSLRRQPSVWDFLLEGKDSFNFGFEAEKKKKLKKIPTNKSVGLPPFKLFFTEPGLLHEDAFPFVLVNMQNNTDLEDKIKKKQIIIITNLFAQ